MYRIEYGNSIVIVSSWSEVISHPNFSDPNFVVSQRTPIGWMA